jgi:hypothetical protein
MEHMFRGRCPTFSLATFDDEWIFLTPKMISRLDGCCYFLLNLHKYGAMNIDDNNTSNDDGCSRKNMIIH